MQEKEELYWYWLCNLSGIGNKRIKRLLDVFKSPKAVFYAAPEALHGCTGLTQQNIETIMKNRNMEKVYKSFTQLQHKGISFNIRKENSIPKTFCNYMICLTDYTAKDSLCAQMNRSCHGGGKRMFRLWKVGCVQLRKGICTTWHYCGKRHGIGY